MSNSTQPDPAKNLNQFNKFLQNNTDFLKQKYTQHYIQPFPFAELQTKSKIQLSIKFIYDVFSFQKYEKDEKMNLTLRKSLRENILAYLKNQGVTEGRKFRPEDAIRLLKFCIENNQMFAVHYDKKEKGKESPAKVEEHKGNQQEQIGQSKVSQHKQQNTLTKQQQQPHQPTQQPSQSNLLSNNSHISQKSSMQSTTLLPPSHPNQFSSSTKTDQQKKQNQILRKQAKIVFQFYCKQQLNTGGPNATFDKISHQSNTMTLGKFMAFANSACILYTTKVQAYKPKNQKVLDKKTINQMFRKISKAQKQIDFEQFFQLIKALNEIDESVYDKLNMNKSQTHNKILRKLKYLNTPFSMKGHLQDETKFVLDEKPYIPINTAHSGKFQSSIKEDIEERRQKLRLLPHQPYPNPNQLKPHDTFLLESQFRNNPLDQQLIESKIKGPNEFLLNRKGESKTTTDHAKPQMSKIRLQNSRVSFDNGQRLSQEINILQGLIVQDDDNDDLFLKDYKIPKLGSNAGIKKRSIHNLSVINRNNQQGRESARKFSGMKSQRKNVVDELKQRIIEVEKSQRKQFATSIDSRKNNRQRY